MNGLTVLSLIVVVLGGIVAYRLGRMHGARSAARGSATVAMAPKSLPVVEPGATDRPATFPSSAEPAIVDSVTVDPPIDPVIVDEYGRLVRSYASEAWSLQHRMAAQARALDRRLDECSSELQRVRGESERYRQVIVDIENNAPPPLLDSPDAPDDLRLIVGVGPVLERLLQQLGIATYRQIARWTERDIDEFDAKLPEFPGRIRRDDWVTQARELHLSKYGERP